MTKKKRNHPDVDEILARPWCYYCERDFDDLKILINHQKAKHFKCERCGRRLNTAGGLSVHMSQVHKENLTAVDNALPNRAGLDIEIFGMEGIPEDVIQQHNQRVLTQYHQAEAERRAATGNTAAGGAAGNAIKKPKIENTSDLKKRLAEHKAAKLAAEQNGGSSGSATPTSIQAQPTAPQPTYAGSPVYPQYQQSYAPAPATTTYGQPTTYTHPPPQIPYNQSSFPQQPLPPYSQAPIPPQPAYSQPPQSYQVPYSQPPQLPFQPPPAFSPPPFPHHPTFAGPQYQPQVPPNIHPPFPGQPVGQSRPFGAGSPAPSITQPPTQSPGQNGLPQRAPSASLPGASGLPQRPAFAAPPVNAFQFQQMHQGQIPAPKNHVLPQQVQNAPQNGHTVPPGTLQDETNSSSIDDLISSASKQADADAAAIAAVESSIAPPSQPLATANQPKEEANDEKSAKKDKEKAKATRLVYSDNEISPEEKMAALSKYAFTPSQKSVMV